VGRYDIVREHERSSDGDGNRNRDDCREGCRYEHRQKHTRKKRIKMTTAKQEIGLDESISIS
jgi:hypothetical protein